MKILRQSGHYSKKALRVSKEFSWVTNFETIVAVIADPANERSLVGPDTHAKISQLFSIYSPDVDFDGVVYMALRGVNDYQTAEEQMTEIDKSTKVIPTSRLCEKHCELGFLQPEQIGLHVVCHVFMKQYNIEFEVPGWENTEAEIALKNDTERLLEDCVIHDYWYMSRRAVCESVLNATDRNVKMMKEWVEKHPEEEYVDWRPDEGWSPDKDKEDEDDLFGD